MDYLIEHKKEKIEDRQITADLQAPISFERKELVRVHAVKKYLSMFRLSKRYLTAPNFRRQELWQADLQWYGNMVKDFTGG